MKKFSIFHFPFPNSQSGFTLLELIVAIGLFAISIYISLGALISLFDANNKSQTLASAMNNLSYAVDGMTRNVRFSDKYHCGDTGSGTYATPLDCPNGDTFLAVNFKGQTVIYRQNGSFIERSDDGGGSYKHITGPDITIDYFRFFLGGATPLSGGDANQPLLRIVIKGHSGVKPSTQTSFDIYTSVSQRDLDI